MSSQSTFAPVVCVTDPTAVPSRWAVNKGTLEVLTDGLKFEGKRPLSIREPVSVGRVHTGAWANDLIRVDFAEGDRIASIYFVVAKRGKEAREATDRLQAMVSSMASEGQAEAQTSSGRTQAIEQHRQALAEQARTTAAGRTWLLVLGAVLLVGGLVVTIVSFAAAEPGGTYVFAYGAVIVGLLLIIRSFIQRTRERG
jgi:hypothetical protein